MTDLILTALRNSLHDNLEHRTWDRQPDLLHFRISVTIDHWSKQSYQHQGPRCRSQMIPIDIHSDQNVLRSRDTHRCGEVVSLAEGKIRRRPKRQKGNKIRGRSSVSQWWTGQRRYEDNAQRAVRDNITGRPGARHPIARRTLGKEKRMERGKNLLNLVPREHQPLMEIWNVSEQTFT